MRKRGKLGKPEFCLTCGTDIEEGEGIKSEGVVYCSKECKDMWEENNGV